MWVNGQSPTFGTKLTFSLTSRCVSLGQEITDCFTACSLLAFCCLFFVWVIVFSFFCFLLMLTGQWMDCHFFSGQGSSCKGQGRGRSSASPCTSYNGQRLWWDINYRRELKCASWSVNFDDAKVLQARIVSRTAWKSFCPLVAVSIVK